MLYLATLLLNHFLLYLLHLTSEFVFGFPLELALLVPGTLPIDVEVVGAFRVEVLHEERFSFCYRKLSFSEEVFILIIHDKMVVHRLVEL